MIKNLICFFLGGFIVCAFFIINRLKNFKCASKCGYNCNKCDAKDCPAKECFKCSKYLILILAIFFSFLYTDNVHAAVNSFSATINGYNLVIGNYWYFQAGNQNIIIDVNGYPDGLENPSDYWYSSLVLCESSPTSPSAIYAQGTNATAIKDLRAIRTNYRCFTDENGNTGKVTAILYQQTGGGSYNKQNFVYYMNTGIVTLLDYNVSLNGYYDLSKFSNINSIIDQRTIVDQNNTIINGQEDIKNNTDEINNNITSDDSDTTSSKCGIICKLKGIFNGIVSLPSKIGELLKSLFIPTNEQLYEIVNDSKELSENFGFVGESVNFFITLFTNLLGLVSQNGCIEFPGFKLSKTSLFDEHIFWNAQNVCLSDNVILADNITQIRFITSIALICLFINFASSMFFKILSKNESYRTNADVYDIGGPQ